MNSASLPMRPYPRSDFVAKGHDVVSGVFGESMRGGG